LEGHDQEAAADAQQTAGKSRDAADGGIDAGLR